MFTAISKEDEKKISLTDNHPTISASTVKNENKLEEPRQFLPFFDNHVQNRHQSRELTQRAIKKEIREKGKLSVKSRRIVKKYSKEREINFSDLGSIYLMERHFGIERGNSLFGNRNLELQSGLISWSQRVYVEKGEGNPWVIFARDNFIFYCKTYNDYYVLDASTGKKVGEATLSDDWLEYIGVDPTYRRKGIGTGLMEAIVDTIGKKFLIPAKGLKQNKFYLTTEGAALINSCISKKIIEEEQCMMDVPPGSPASTGSISPPRRRRY